MDEADRELSRLRWQCRRGMLELDLVLAAFLDQHYSALTPAEIMAFADLLEYPDPELWRRIIVPDAFADERCASLLRRLRAARTSS